VSKRMTKEEVKEDRVAVAVTQAAEYAKQNSRWLIAGAAAVVVAIVVVVLVLQGRVKAEESASVGMAQAQNLYFTGDFAQASTQFQAMADRYGSTKEGRVARLLEGNSQLAVGNATAAEQAFRRFLDKGKPDGTLEAAARRGLGGSLCAQQKYPEAAASFAAAAKIAGNALAGEDWLQAGLANLKAGQKAEAAEAFRKVIEDYGTSTAAGEARVRLHEIEGR
jgi:TolA-binding protein